MARGAGGTGKVTSTGKITIDKSKAVRDLAQLARGIDGGAQHVAVDQAETTAAKIDSYVPVRTGRLASTVTSRVCAGGAEVTYGGGLPYAGYIENRAHPVRKGARGARTDFFRRLQELAAAEVTKV